MHRAVVNVTLVLLLLAPHGQAQWLTDDQGDAKEQIAGVDASYGRAGATDIHWIDVEETVDDLILHVAHAAPPSNEVDLVDGTYYSMHFRHGENEYRASVQRVEPLGEDQPQYYSNLYEDGNQRSYLGSLETESTDDGFKVTIEKDKILDEHGARPAKGSALAGFRAFANTQSFTICVGPGECVYPGPRATDRAPNTGEASPYEFQFGLPQDGDIRLESEAPVRWSNGAATTFVYEVIAHNQGSEQDTITIATSNIPDGWVVAQIPAVQLQAKESRAIPIPVKVPFAHEHGEDPRFLVEALGKNGVGRIELGVHYPAIPQPTGHHSEIFIHTRTEDTFIFAEVIYNAAGGNMGEVAFMNTDEGYDMDENVRVMGAKGTVGAKLDGALEGEVPEYGVVYQWAVPLSPELRVGLRADAENDTEGTVNLEFDAPVGDVRVFGRLAVLHEEDLSGQFFDLDTTAGETLATIPLSDTSSVSGSVNVPVTLSAEEPVTIPYAADQALVAFIEAHVLRPDFVLSPNTGVYLTGGELTLPLQEYHDVVPINVTFPEEVQKEAIQSLDAPPASTEAKDTPMASPAVLIGALGLATWRLRRNG